MLEDSGEKNVSIEVLPWELVRKIAAGEVIDRPAALAREFIDNAIDAGGKNLELLLEGGGITRTELIDDGEGMTRDDLELCWQTHATSKIRTLDDLSSATTLGFRGEALAAAAAVAKLEVLSSRDGREAWRLEVESGKPSLARASRAKGSSVRALGLFDAIPARRRFLKREASEALLSKQIMTDKALAFPGVSFRFVQDGVLKEFLPAAAGFRERFGAALLRPEEADFLHEIYSGGPGFSVTVVLGGPELARRDRRQQYVFANGRRIQDFSLMQALEYGTEGNFPNGTHPVGAVFVDIDPALADFNIHPAKREVRFRDPAAVHHAVTSAVRDFTRRRNIAGFGPRKTGRDTPKDARGAMEALLSGEKDFALPPRREAAYDTDFYSGLAAGETEKKDYAKDSGNEERETLRYAGRLFNLFIIVEYGGKVYIIDQHAAHERILFEDFLSKPIPRQELLVPIPLETEDGEDEKFLELAREDLKSLGVIVVRGGEGGWHIEALPSAWKLGDRETVREILSLRNSGENMARRWAATLACHAAVKDGDALGAAGALELAEKALALSDPRCPHGRPLWMEIPRGDIMRAVRRGES